MAEAYRTRPNVLTGSCAPGDTAIRILAADFSSYTTYALLIAAGKQPWPGLDQGLNQSGVLSVRSFAAGDATDGSDFFYLYNQVKPSSVDNMIPVSGGGQERENLPTVWQFWFAMTASTDILKVTLEY